MGRSAKLWRLHCALPSFTTACATVPSFLPPHDMPCAVIVRRDGQAVKIPLGFEPACLGPCFAVESAVTHSMGIAIEIRQVNRSVAKAEFLTTMLQDAQFRPLPRRRAVGQMIELLLVRCFYQQMEVLLLTPGPTDLARSHPLRQQLRRQPLLTVVDADSSSYACPAAWREQIAGNLRQAGPGGSIFFTVRKPRDIGLATVARGDQRDIG